MVNDVIQSVEFKNLMCKQVKDMVVFLLERNSEFALTVKLLGKQLPKSLIPQEQSRK